MWLVYLLLIYCFSLTTCRPSHQDTVQTNPASAEPQVEIERQLVHEVIPLEREPSLPDSHHLAQRKIAQNTRDILEKIAEVNKNQGLIQKKHKPNYFHFPFSYSRSQEQDQRSNSWKFSRDPFTNPILEYIEKEEEKQDKNEPIATFRRPNFDSDQHPPDHGISVMDTDPEITADDQIPGQYIKRKVTHYQSFLVPNPYMLNMLPPRPSVPPTPFFQPNAFGNANLNQQYPSYLPNNPAIPNKNRTSLEKETIDNIKNIVIGGQVPQVPTYQQAPEYNPYYLSQIYQGLPMQTSTKAASLHKARQNWNWPGANFFPIYIRDPFLQMYYAVTNMIEYGPSAGNDGPCKLTPRPQGSRIKTNSKVGQPVESKTSQVTVEMNKREETGEVKVVEVDGKGLAGDIGYLDVEDIDLGDDDLVRFTVNLPVASATGGRELKDDLKEQKMGWEEFIQLRNRSFLSHLTTGKADFQPNRTHNVTEQLIQVEEVEDDPVESEKSEDISIANQGSKKVFSKDNTGSGIFIQKLKVRKGGVAIAGPGGIATAGSGGTAIVGPNGVAYTHPNGLAIAGSGTKVVAVDPNVDLNDAIKDSVLNGTRHVPNTRVGKVVAVGPVVYYNRG